MFKFVLDTVARGRTMTFQGIWHFFAPGTAHLLKDEVLPRGFKPNFFIDWGGDFGKWYGHLTTEDGWVHMELRLPKKSIFASKGRIIGNYDFKEGKLSVSFGRHK